MTSHSVLLDKITLMADVKFENLTCDYRVAFKNFRLKLRSVPNNYEYFTTMKKKWGQKFRPGDTLNEHCGQMSAR